MHFSNHSLLASLPNKTHESLCKRVLSRCSIFAKNKKIAVNKLFSIIHCGGLGSGFENNVDGFGGPQLVEIFG